MVQPKIKLKHTIKDQKYINKTKVNDQRIFLLDLN